MWKIIFSCRDFTSRFFVAKFCVPKICLLIVWQISPVLGVNGHKVLCFPFVIISSRDALLIKQMPKKQTGFVLVLKQNKLDLVFHLEN